MALQKQAVPINFAQGLDQKTDDKQVQPGKFLALSNTVFTKMGLLQKRNGFGNLPALPDTSTLFATTFNGNLTAVGNKFEAFSSSSGTWVNKGPIQPLELSTLPLIRSNTNQSQADAAVAPNGLVCTVFTDNVPVAGSNTLVYKYAVANSVTGQNVVAPTVIPGAHVIDSPRVFVLGRYFIIMFTNVIATVNHLQYIAISWPMPTTVIANTDISAQYTPSSTINFDAYIVSGSLYVAWNGNDGGGAIRMTRIDANLAQHNTVVFTGRVATLMSVTADISGNSPVIWATFYNSGDSTGYALAVNTSLITILAPTQYVAAVTILNVTAAAQNGVNTIFYEVANNYSYDSAIPTHFIRSRTLTQTGTLGTVATIIRSVGLASKAFLVNGTAYMLVAYFSVFQPTYFLIDGTGRMIAKIAYSNGGGYLVTGLPSVTVVDNVAKMSYLIKDLIAAVNKTQGAASAAGVYSQTGVNLVSFTIGTSNIVTAEIGNDLHLTGGFLWMYDGYSPVEHGFEVWPDNVEVTTSPTGGLLEDQEYFYQVTYEWTDNQGNVHRSAPSIPVSVTTAGGDTSSNTIFVPTLRLTYKIANPVKIVIYRWSTAQQVYYQVTSLAIPLLNDTGVDSVQYVDTLADSAIIGNSIIYTTGGVLENIAAPATGIITLFNNRLWLIPSEDTSLLWYSKQVIEAVPVETSDLLTLFVAPTTSAQGSTGGTKSAAPMDDKLVLFKKNAIYYINGQGPDNTGANSQYSDAIFITSTVGCENQQSIVFMPNGLMFQSDKGIWLLGRDLSTTYIGAPVENFTTTSKVLSALNIPGTNQVRFTMDSGITLMYDYYFGQWGSFSGIPSVSSTLYNSLHTYINSFGQVLQETPGVYLDAASPVLMSFTTSWFNLAGLQGYERAYFFYLLGTYISPHKLSVQIAYDYNPSPTQVSVIKPDNFSPSWGNLPLWGSDGPWGGSADPEQWRVFLQRQKCQAFQITVQESFDATVGVPAGAGLTLSGIDLVVGLKKGYKPLRAARSVG